MGKKQDRQDYYHSVINGLKIDDSLILRNLKFKERVSHGEKNFSITKNENSYHHRY